MTKPEKARGPSENDRLDSFLDIISSFVGDIDNKKILDKKEVLDSLDDSKKKLVNKKELIDLLIDTLATKMSEKNSQKTSGLVAEIFIPVEIFSGKLSGLEALVKFLKENKQLSVSEIASKLNRDSATIWTTYNNSLEKQRGAFEITDEPEKIPLKLFANRILSVTEVVVKFLKDKGLKYSQIGRILNRDQRNIWSTYSRVKKKMNGEKGGENE